MSEAMKEVYRDGYREFPASMLHLLFPDPKPKSVEERSREAVVRIFEAVDKARDDAAQDN